PMQILSVDGGHCALWLEPAVTFKALFQDLVTTRLASYREGEYCASLMGRSSFELLEMSSNQQYFSNNPLFRSADVLVAQWVGEAGKLRVHYSKPVIAYLGFLLLNDPVVGKYHPWSEPLEHYWERPQQSSRFTFLQDCDVHSLQGKPPKDGGAVVYEEPQLAEAAYWQTGFHNPSVRPLSLYVGATHRAELALEDFGDRGLEDVPRIRAFGTLLDRRAQAAPPRPKPKRVKRASGKKRKNHAASSQSVEKVQERPSDKLENLPSSKSKKKTKARKFNRARFDRAVQAAELKRAALVGGWRNLGRGRKRKAIDPKDFADEEEGQRRFLRSFQDWLQDRGLEDCLRRDARRDPAAELGIPSRPFMYFKYKAPSAKKGPTWACNARMRPGRGWKRAYHGTWFYGLGSILQHGVLLESVNEDAGHEFWKPGLYLTPKLGTATWYGRAQRVFEDDMFHRAIVEVKYDPSKKKVYRERGGGQIVVTSEAAAITGIIIQPNSPPMRGEERSDSWEAQLEC
ncbi:unnamed protein product, partial [Symbiodinium microadriaticum]